MDGSRVARIGATLGRQHTSRALAAEYCGRGRRLGHPDQCAAEQQSELQNWYRGGRLMMISKFDSAFNSFKSQKSANNSDRCLKSVRVKRRGIGLLSIALLAAALQ